MSKIYDASFSDATLEQFIERVYRHTGITMAKTRKTMLQGRIRPRAKQLAMESYEQYLDYLDSNPSEVLAFVDLVTTNETYFFRTPRIWEHFQQVFLPDWAKTHSQQTLRMWSAASSSGEEAYTMAILCEEFKETHPEFRYQVLGTDISSEVLETARAAKYSGRSIEMFRNARPTLFQNYLEPKGDGFVVKPEIRARVDFKTHHLFQVMKRPEPFDWVCLRNVLIYFNPNDQIKVLQNIRPSMREGSTLVIGESESLGRFSVPFKYVTPLIYTCESDAQTKKDQTERGVSAA